MILFTKVVLLFCLSVVWAQAQEIVPAPTPPPRPGPALAKQKERAYLRVLNASVVRLDKPWEAGLDVFLGGKKIAPNPYK